MRGSYACYHTHLGAALWRAGRRVEAERAFAKAEAIDPDDAYAHHLLGLTYRAPKRPAARASKVAKTSCLLPYPKLG